MGEQLLHKYMNILHKKLREMGQTIGTFKR